MFIFYDLMEEANGLPIDRRPCPFLADSVEKVAVESL